MNLLPMLKEHCARYPAMTTQDCVKLLYQAVLGPSHLGRNGIPQPSYIANEMSKAKKRDLPLSESIGNGLCRLHLDSLQCQLRPETIHGLFMETAQKHKGTLEQLQEQLALWAKNPSPFSKEDAEKEIGQLEASSYAPVSHSEAYHQAYDPHYRLIQEKLLAYVPLLEAIDQRMQAGQRTLLAIDGRCASGKSTLGQLLSDIYSCPLIHMDDFFLPFPRKTPERLAEPGGNVDRERFHEEVILPYQAVQPLSYGVYDCSVGAITRKNTVEQAPLMIVEGSYSLHPLYQDAYDLKVFLSCDPELQSQRIMKRNGPELHRRFVEAWIPMEEQYFSAFSIPKQCDFIIYSDN